MDDTPQTDYPRLDGDRSVDVAVIGGGITGLTTALLLARDGQQVFLLDQDVIASVPGARTSVVILAPFRLASADACRQAANDRLGWLAP